MAPTLSYAGLLVLSLASVTLASDVAAPGPTPAPDHKEVKKALQKRASGDGNTPLPLTQYTYAYNDVPAKVNPFQYLRGPQSGTNQCNGTVASPDAQCQTALVNSLSDFCLWGSPTNSTDLETIGDIEAAVVAYCTTNKWGSRVIKPGAITGAQFMRTSAYIQVVGRIDQTALGLTADDTGGELDPHGADLLGNPLGGLMYSTSLAATNTTSTTPMQAYNWNNFVGGGVFCFKLCFNNVTSPDYCQNKFDLLGCSYNMPAAYVDGEFSSCEGALQDEAGVYTGSDGKVSTFVQPSSLDAGTTLPWTPRVPASSNCQSYASSDLFPASLLGYQSTAAATSTSATSAATSGASAGTGTGAQASRTTGGSAPGATTTGSPATGAAAPVKAAGAALVLVAAVASYLF